MSILHTDGGRSTLAHPELYDIDIVDNRIQFQLRVDLGFHQHHRVKFVFRGASAQAEDLDAIKAHFARMQEIHCLDPFFYVCSYAPVVIAQSFVWEADVYQVEGGIHRSILRAPELKQWITFAASSEHDRYIYDHTPHVASLIAH